MFIEEMVYECDFTGRKYDMPVPGGGALSMGASGRVCVVMHAGPEFLAENGYTLMTYEEAYAWAKETGGYLDV